MNKNMTFESAMGKLDEIVNKLESGNETLEGSLKLFEEGSALASLCYGKLKNAEQKIKQISEFKDDDGDENG
jgi:exodeoxyribonuclease VII small subunit